MIPSQILYLLNNSNVYLSINSPKHEIELKFIAYWFHENQEIQKEVILRCQQLHAYNISCDPEQPPPYVVGEVHITEDLFQNRVVAGWAFNPQRNLLGKKVWIVKLAGSAIDVEIICLAFQWEEIKL